MSAEFTISEDDYARAVQLGSPLAPWRIGLLVLMGLVLIACAIWGPSPVREASMGGLLVLLAVVAGSRLFLVRYMARKSYRSYKAIQMPVHAELTADGLALRSSDGEGVLRWDKVLKWRQDDKLVLIYLAPRLFHIVPKSIASQGFDLQGLLHALQTKVGPAV
jgi:hypothetical protein